MELPAALRPLTELLEQAPLEQAAAAAVSALRGGSPAAAVVAAAVLAANRSTELVADHHGAKC